MIRNDILYNMDHNKNIDSLVSIIMPTYKCGKFIEESIKSIQAQTYQNWELIIVDDCSGDGTVDIVMDLKKADDRMYEYKKEFKCQ